MKNCCLPTFLDFYKLMRKSVLYKAMPVMKCKKHNRNVFLSKNYYNKVRRLSVVRGTVYLVFGGTFMFYFFGGLATKPIALVGTLLLVIFLSLCYSLYKKTCKNMKYYHISNKNELNLYEINYNKNNK